MKRIIAFIVFICSSAVLLHAIPVFAQTQTGKFTLTPTSSIITQNNTQTYTVGIDTGSTKILGADAIMSFPKDLLEAKTITNGNFFANDDFSSGIDNNNGRVELHGFIFTGDGKSGTGTFATVQFLAKAGSGTGELSFRCNTANPTSKMPDEDGTNIINCSLLPTAGFSLTGNGDSPTPTPTPTATPTPTPTPTVTTTPQPTATQAPQQPGNADPTCSGLTIMPSSGKSPLNTTFICTGNDTDGEITAAEFLFGDGRVQLVAKNVGNYGSISTTAAYNVAGSYAISCRVRDNKDRFSGIPDACRKTLDVSAATATSTTKSRIIVAAAKPLPRADEPQIINLAPSRPTETPTPRPTFESLPEPTEEPVVKESSSPWGTIVGIGIVLGSLALGGWLILKSRKPNIPPPPPPQQPITA